MPAQFDVIVAGGGVIGASIAWRLARDRLRVLLLDAATVGSEASSAAAGMLAPGGEFDEPGLLEFATRSLTRYPDFIAEVESDSGLAVEFRHTGAVQIALTPAEIEPLSERAASQRAAGIPSYVLTRAELRELVPAVREDAAGGIRYTNEAIVDPMALIRALRAACLARGVSVQENSRVASIAADVRGARVCIPGQLLQARHTVLAAGAWTGGVQVSVNDQPCAFPRSFPVKGHLLGYRLAPGSLPITLRHHHTYLLQRADGFTIAGSSTEHAGFDRDIHDKIVSDIAARAATLVPALGAHQPQTVWTGLRPAIDAPAPQIGRVRDSRLWLAYGHYRNGILLAPGTADRISRDLAAALALE
jgi:glycine oxidase